MKAIKEHVLSYNPSISHYRIEHAPNRLYISQQYTIKGMVEDFNQNDDGKKVSYATYHRVIHEMKISFCKLGEEECELCELQEKTFT